MNKIEKILSVRRVLLVWQSMDQNERGERFGERFIVGKIEPKTNNYVLTYEEGSDDYNKAIAKGFKGYPAFSLDKKEHTKNVMEIFSSRLPPRTRGDFTEYLNSFCLPANFVGDNFSLIAQTGGKLLSDRFSFLPEINTNEEAFDYLSEVAGVRYCLSETNILDQIEIGHEVTFKLEPENQYDKNAINVFYESTKIGYVNRVHCSVVKHYLEKNRIHAFVGKKNGTKERPLIYIILKVR